MRNFSVISKGHYTHQQTSEVIHIERFLIVKKKKHRVLLLNINNRINEILTGLHLQIDQFDVRGKNLGSVQVEYTEMNVLPGAHVLKKEIEIHRSCIDFHVQVIAAKYSNYVYRLGDHDTYVTYEKPEEKIAFNRKAMRKKMKNRNFDSRERKFKVPKFVCAFMALLTLVPVGVAIWQINEYKESRIEMIQEGEVSPQVFKSNVVYEFVSSNVTDDTPVNVVGFTKGLGGAKIDIPTEIDGHKVQRIVSGAFEEYNQIEELTIGENILIEDYAFAGCYRLEKVTVKGLTSIGNEAFKDCTGLTSFQAENVLKIGREAFSGCHALTDLRIESKNDDAGKVEIGMNAFFDCRAFNSIYIDRFINSSSPAIFSMVKSVEELYLKNYNYTEPEAEVASAAAAKTLSALFGGYEAKVGSLHIEYTDEIPANFAQNCGKELVSVTIDHITTPTIGDNAFADCKMLSEFSFPKSATYVGERAFANTQIKEFDGTCLSNLGESAFSGCTQLETFTTSDNVPLSCIPVDAFNGCSALQDILIPSAVKSIDTAAFNACENLRTLTFAKGSQLLYIMRDAFNGCKKLRAVALPSQIRTVSEHAFSDCYSLRRLTIPQGSHNLDDNAFHNCYKLYEIDNYSDSNITVGHGVAKHAFAVYTTALEAGVGLNATRENGFVLAQKWGTWYAIDYEGAGGDVVLPTPQGINEYTLIDHLFTEDETVTGVTIPSRVKALQGSIFESSVVERVTFEESREKITLAEDVFIEASTLTSVEFGGRPFGELYDAMFHDCYSLELIDLPAGITRIPMSTFENCSSLETVMFAENTQLKSVGLNAFKGCYNLKEFLFDEHLEKIEKRAFYECFSLETPLTNVANLKTIETEAFYGCNDLPEINLQGIQKLEEKAFIYCSGMKEASLGAGITEILPGTFRGCYSLKNITLPKNLEKINERAFYECYNLQELFLPNSVEVIEKEAFFGNSALKSVEGGFRTNIELDEEGNLISHYIATNAFFRCFSLETVSGMYNLQRIDYRAFYDCDSLKNVTDMMNLQFIAEEAFYNCSSLLEIDDMYELKVIEANAFYGCSDLTTFTMAENLQTIGEKAFYECTSLQGMYGNQKLQSIGAEAFYGCTALEKFEMPALKNLEEKAFMDCTALQEIVLPEGLTYIPAAAFKNCTAMEMVVLPSSLGAIASGYDEDGESISAFENCPILHEVYNNTKYSISRDSEEFGMVAYNALIVESGDGTNRLQELRVGDYIFKHRVSDYNSPWFMTEYLGLNTYLTLDEIVGTYYTVEKYEIAKNVFKDTMRILRITILDAVTCIRPSSFNNLSRLREVYFENADDDATNDANIIVPTWAFTDCDRLTTVVIPQSLKGIAYYAIENEDVTVYYHGTESAWSKNANKYKLYIEDVYYYDACAHGVVVTDVVENGEDQKREQLQWKYTSKGEVNDSAKDFDYTHVQPNCTQDGLEEIYCEDCGYYDGWVIEAYGHSFDEGRRGYCYNCGYIYDMNVNSWSLSDAKELISFSSSGGDYDLFKTSNNKIKPTNTERGSSSTLTITAKEKVVALTFEIYNMDIYGSVTITTGAGSFVLTYEASQTVNVSLEKGESISIRYARTPLVVDPNESSDSTGISTKEDGVVVPYITNFVLTGEDPTIS